MARKPEGRPAVTTPGANRRRRRSFGIDLVRALAILSAHATAAFAPSSATAGGGCPPPRPPLSPAFARPASARGFRRCWRRGARVGMGMAFAGDDAAGTGGGVGENANGWRGEGEGLGTRLDSYIDRAEPRLDGYAPSESNSPSSPIKERKIDYVGAGTFGDIISADDEEEDGELEEEAGGDGIVVNSQGVAVSGPNGGRSRIQRHHLKSPTKSGLVTTAGGTLQSRFGAKVNHNLSPLDRIALTANGNLQRIFSSYYDAPVHVHVDRCELRRSSSGDVRATDDGGFVKEGAVDGPNGAGIVNGANGASSGNGDAGVGIPPPPAVWDRTVHLSVHGRTFCVAKSIVTVNDRECIKLIHAGEVGIGQLFRHLDKLPTFELLDAGRAEEGGGGLWRLYALKCDELTCRIREEFIPDAWEIMPPGLDHYEEHDNTF